MVRKIPTLQQRLSFVRLANARKQTGNRASSVNNAYGPI